MTKKHGQFIENFNAGNSMLGSRSGGSDLLFSPLYTKIARQQAYFKPF
jgi:hypothetical protein